MSHFTTIKTEVRDLETLRDACVEMDLVLESGIMCRGFGGINRTAHRIVRLKGPYDIAVDPAEAGDGTYALTTDWWGGHVEIEVGIGYGRLLQSYGVQKTMREARSRGLRFSRQIEPDGCVLLTLEGGAL
ncbi:DUF1257 domain-containing protein [Luteolibacter sp. Populi]|uniref:DUF1257 domain-containing protein n=1 Tax=Luteolibacter sp. Populi TaxID=3230487 RepID=UPI00346668D5